TPSPRTSFLVTLVSLLMIEARPLGRSRQALTHPGGKTIHHAAVEESLRNAVTPLPSATRGCPIQVAYPPRDPRWREPFIVAGTSSMGELRLELGDRPVHFPALAEAGDALGLQDDQRARVAVAHGPIEELELVDARRLAELEGDLEGGRLAGAD